MDNSIMIVPLVIATKSKKPFFDGFGLDLVYEVPVA
jgi:hypothetical protein